MRSRKLLVFALGSTLSCGSASEPLDPGNGLLTTDASSYVARLTGPGSYSLRIITRYANPSDTAIRLGRCYPDTPYPMYGVKLVSPENPQGSAWNPNWGCVGLRDDQLLLVPPHMERVDTFNMIAPNTWDGITHQHYGELSGRFRIVYGGQASNEFTITSPLAGAFK